MNAKEKAQELVDKFKGNKKFALICCDEIINLRMINNMGRGDGQTESDFWEQVKTEIKNL